MQDPVTRMLCMDINALASKIVAMLGQTHESVLAAGSLASAAYILSGDVSSLEEPDTPPARSRQAPAMPPPMATLPNPGGLDVADLARAVATRLGGNKAVVAPDPEDQPSLADKWSGPLPSLNGKSKRQTRSAAKPEAKIPVAAPGSLCRCGEPVNEHPRAKNLPPDSKGRPVFVICGSTMVHCVPSDSEIEP